MKKTLLCLLLLLVRMAPVSAYETLSAAYMTEPAPMTIDGELDDWTEIPAQEVPVINQIDNSGNNIRDVIETDGPTDLSYAFKCFADNRYVYFALMVKDDDVLIGDQVFGEGWKEDSTTLYFDGDCVNVEKPYFDENDGNLKVIGAPPDGVSWIEGLIPYFKIQVPYFWESRGVKSGFSRTPDGYTIELAIPFDVLGWDAIAAGKTMGMNTRVVDMDTTLDTETTDKGLIWAPDPDHSCHYMTKNYNRIVFDTPIESENESHSGATVIGSESRELEITLGAPDYTDGEALFDEVLADISVADFAAAEQKLAAEKERVWVQPLLAVMQLKQDKIEEGVNQLFEFGENCPDEFAEAWVRTFLKNEVRWVYEVFKGEKIIFQEQVYNSVANILDIYSNKYTDDGEGLYIAGIWASNAKRYLTASNHFRKSLAKSRSNLEKIKLELAKNLFFLGKFSESAEIASELAFEDNGEYSLEATYILKSIDSSY